MLSSACFVGFVVRGDEDDKHDDDDDKLVIMTLRSRC